MRRLGILTWESGYYVIFPEECFEPSHTDPINCSFPLLVSLWAISPSFELGFLLTAQPSQSHTDILFLPFPLSSSLFSCLPNPLKRRLTCTQGCHLWTVLLSRTGRGGRGSGLTALWSPSVNFLWPWLAQLPSAIRAVILVQCRAAHSGAYLPFCISWDMFSHVCLF